MVYIIRQGNDNTHHSQRYYLCFCCIMSSRLKHELTIIIVSNWNMIGMKKGSMISVDYSSRPTPMQLFLHWRGHVLTKHWRHITWLDPNLWHSSFMPGPLAAALQTLVDSGFVLPLVSICQWASYHFDSCLALLALGNNCQSVARSLPCNAAIARVWFGGVTVYSCRLQSALVSFLNTWYALSVGCASC